jgi:molybdenum cofactor cytidylyltransferase
VLAAGLGRRFGGTKLLVTFRGRPLVSHVLEAAAAARDRGLLASVHAVVAEGDAAIAKLAASAGAAVVTNPEPGRGLSSSLKLGLAALPPDLDAVLVLLGDQPLVRPGVMEALVNAWRQGELSVVRPRYASAPDAPGHPVLIARRLWPLAAGLEGDSGFGSLCAPDAPDVMLLDVPGDNPDVDTPADLLALKDPHP